MVPISNAASACFRYPFYALSIAGMCPPVLHWLRYTAFIALYPLGFAGELGTWVVGMPHIKVGVRRLLSLTPTPLCVLKGMKKIDESDMENFYVVLVHDR